MAHGALGLFRGRMAHSRDPNAINQDLAMAVGLFLDNGVDVTNLSAQRPRFPENLHNDRGR